MLRKITLVAAVAAALLLPVPAFAGHGHGGWHGGHGWHVVTGVAIMGGAVGGVGEDGAGAAGGVRASTSISDAAIRIMDMGTIHTTAMATTALFRLLSPLLLSSPLRVLSPIPSLPPLALCATSLVVPSCSRFRQQEALARLR